MSSIQSLIRAPSSPITVVYSGAAFYSGSDAIWSLTAPDPGVLLAGDVVLLFVATQNGNYNVWPIGHTHLGGASYYDGTRQYETAVWALRSAGGSLPVGARYAEFFVNQIGSSGAIAIMVLRGVRNSGAIGSDITPRDASVAIPGNTAALLSSTRTVANSLALHFAHVSGGAGAAPPGWAERLNSSGVGHVYAESQYFPAVGTTAAVSRTPAPTTRYSTALIHAIAQ